MSGPEFKALCCRLFGRGPSGQHGWQSGAAEALGYHVNSIARWAYGQLPVPRVVEIAILAMKRERFPEEEECGSPNGVAGDASGEKRKSD